jgi:hypothetical protein
MSKVGQSYIPGIGAALHVIHVGYTILCFSWPIMLFYCRHKSVIDRDSQQIQISQSIRA